MSYISLYIYVESQEFYSLPQFSHDWSIKKHKSVCYKTLNLLKDVFEEIALLHTVAHKYTHTHTATPLREYDPTKRTQPNKKGLTIKTERMNFEEAFLHFCISPFIS